MKTKELKTVDINAREWFDRPNGNTYFTAIVTLNSGLPNEETHRLPFQYGGGYLIEQMAGELIWQIFPRTLHTRKRNPLWMLRYDGVKIATSSERTGKRKCKALVS